MVVAGVDELYQTNAIRYKILGFHRFLRETRNYGKPYRLIQVCYRQRSQEASVKRSRLYENQIREAAMACNAEFPGSVELHMLTGSFYPVEERMALWRVAKIYLNTSLAQGLNLHPQEFLMARKEEGGIVIMSEFGQRARVPERRAGGEPVGRGVDHEPAGAHHGDDAGGDPPGAAARPGVDGSSRAPSVVESGDSEPVGVGGADQAGGTARPCRRGGE